MTAIRRLAAILAADVAGYSRLMGADEEGTLERLKALRRELLDPKITEHRGRIVKTTGDGLLVEFASVVDAVRCAVAVQQAMPERNTSVSADSRIELPIGINLGDVAGYSRLMGADEEGTLERLKALRRELFDPKIAEHRGRIVKTTGDGLLVEFASPVEAVRCAGEIQKAMRDRESSLPEDHRIEIRVGINLGDVIIDEDDVYGDGVNIAARLEALADPGSVVISSAVFEQVRDRVPDRFEDLGDQQVKNIARPVRVYRLAQLQTPVLPTAMSPLPLPDKPSIAVLPFANM